MRTYRLSAAGRRLNLALLVGALLIWFFALWSLGSTLGLQYDPARFLASVADVWRAELRVTQVVPALLMVVLVVATPLLVWNVLLEWAASYTPTPDGLRFESLGVQVLYPWETVQDLRAVDDDADEPLDEMIVTADQTGQITNSLVRLLYRQAYGRLRLPIPAGVADRDALIIAIRTYAGLPAPQHEHSALAEHAG